MKTKIELMLGDCLDRMKEIPDRSIDMVLADLPYGTTACKWDSVISFELLWKQYKRIIKSGASIVLFGSEPFSSIQRMSNLSWFKYDWIWDKVRPSGFQIAKFCPMKRHETISVFCQKTPNWNPIKEKRNKSIKGRVCSKSDSSPLTYSDGITRIYNDKNPQSILVFSKQSDGKYVHPTQKPIALMEYLIRTYTNEFETVLDNTMGSGTTGVACVNTNRNFIGIEQDFNYFKIAEERINSAQEQLI